MFGLQQMVIAAVVAAFVGFGAGWSANGWRLGVSIAELEGVNETQKQSIATLKGVNESCAAGVHEVKGAVAAIFAESDARTAAAAAAAQAAAAAAAGIQKDAKAALARPPAPPGKECETAASEATGYAKKRRGQK